jgi:negative regulator of flagellin synthesis FlgM
MKVEKNLGNRINPSEPENLAPVDKTTRQSESSKAGALGGKDKATLSEQARLLARAHSALEAAPEVRADRVEELRKQIENGTYQVPHEELVKKLLNQVRLNGT